MPRKIPRPIITVTKTRTKARKYEQFHDKFLSYKKIEQYLIKMQKEYPKKIHLKIIGKSKCDRNIYMAIISQNHENPVPKLGTMVEAGSNGKHWMTVSTALYIVDYLLKNSNLVLIMDYYIIPCSNPDAYDHHMKKCPKNRYIKNDLSKSYPINNIDKLNCNSISPKTWQQCLREYKNNLSLKYPETDALITTIVSYQFVAKLFVSLQANGKSICYPFGCSEFPTEDVGDLKKVAQSANKQLQNRYQVGTIFDVHCLSLGNIVDFIKSSLSSIKFAYVLNIQKANKRPEQKKILEVGESVLGCIKNMARNVFMYYQFHEVNLDLLNADAKIDDIIK